MGGSLRSSSASCNRRLRDAAPGRPRSSKGGRALVQSGLPKGSNDQNLGSGDTASWLVQDLVSPDTESAAPADEDWVPEGVASSEFDDDGGTPAPAAGEEGERKEEASPGADEELVPDGASEDLAGAVSELRRELAKSTVELDRLSGRIREEVAAEVDQRREELALDGSVVHEVRSHAKAFDRMTKALETLSSRMDGLEERLGAVAADTGSVQDTLAVMARYGPAEDAGTQAMNLNEASFEDLRRVGFSATQAARVLTHRDAFGGFDSVERLRQVPGLPEKLLERIRPRLGA